jgi:Secretion system C-terminal sorting domain
VYNLAGVKVKTVLNNAFTAGQYTITIDLKGLATGIYFYRMETESFSETKRMMVLE